MVGCYKVLFGRLQVVVDKLWVMSSARLRNADSDWTRMHFYF